MAALAWIVGLAVDQITKAIAADRLADRGSVRVVGSLLQLDLTRNAGAAFSTGTQFTVVLSCLAAAATVVVVIIALRARTVVWAIALGLLLAGITGNLTDRLFRAPGPLRGHVIDFLMLPHWPVFNVADICITLAAALIVVQAYRGVRLDGRREDRS
ncbi:signal peptidase II [Nocardioides sp. CER19]|uniref:signal peptidase II n=1 Tax=Nocardioides sp. CER19 TaxID=3038538 RepID=UPI0024470E36|nr:signal peptidase II [Nocardioides sp. CER19]MDH2416691.1 signal peptidase II [Nocardioides sp. CER19]